MTRNRMRSLPVVLLVVVLLLGACDWSQSRFGSGRTGASPDTALSPANVAQLTLRWHQVAGRSGRFWTPGGFVVTGGSVFAPVAGTSKTGIEALDAATSDGRWITPTPMGDASVDASANGFVFTHGNDLEVFDAATGALRWSVSGDTYGTDGSTVVGDTVYVDAAGSLRALDAASGALRWQWSGADGPRTAPAVMDGRAFVATMSGKVVAVDAATGATRWSVTPSGWYAVGPVTAVDGLVLASLVSTSGSAHAERVLDAVTGATRRTATVGDATQQLAVSGDAVFVATRAGLEALDRGTGQVRWSVPLGGAPSSPTVADGVVYVGTGDSRLVGYDAASGAVLWTSPKTSAPITDGPVIANGTVFVMADDGTLSAYSLPVPGVRLGTAPAFPDLGRVHLGATTPPVVVKVTNFGSVASGAFHVALEGADAPSFRLTADGCSGVSLAPNATCTLDAVFAPSAAGLRSATLAVAAPAGTTTSATLSGHGIGPALSTVPTSLDFGPVAFGGSASASLVVTNPGTSASGTIATGVYAASAGFFTFSADSCTGASLAPKATCRLTVTFRPNGSGDFYGAMGLAPADADTTALSVHGTGR